jgi:hypothetical protein
LDRTPHPDRRRLLNTLSSRPEHPKPHCHPDRRHLLNTLSSRPQRSGVEGPAVRSGRMFVHFTVTFERREAASNPFHFVIPTGAEGPAVCPRRKGNSHHPRYHSDRRAPPDNFVIPTGAKRSGGTCCSPATEGNSCHPRCRSDRSTPNHLSSRPERRDLLFASDGTNRASSFILSSQQHLILQSLTQAPIRGCSIASKSTLSTPERRRRGAAVSPGRSPG